MSPTAETLLDQISALGETVSRSLWVNTDTTDWASTTFTFDAQGYELADILFWDAGVSNTPRGSVKVPISVPANAMLVSVSGRWRTIHISRSGDTVSISPSQDSGSSGIKKLRPIRVLGALATV